MNHTNPSQLRPIASFLVHKTKSNNLVISFLPHSSPNDRSPQRSSLQNLTIDLDSFANPNRPAKPDLQSFRRTSAPFTWDLARLDIVNVAVHDRSCALRHTIQQSGDGASVDSAELVAVLWRERDAERGCPGHACFVAGAREDLDGCVESGVEVVWGRQGKVGRAVGFESCEDPDVVAVGNGTGSWWRRRVIGRCSGRRCRASMLIGLVVLMELMEARMELRRFETDELHHCCHREEVCVACRTLLAEYIQ